MDGNELSTLIHHRWQKLRELLEIGNRQLTAIQTGRISDLMRLLSEKQTPLNELAELANRIRAATHDDPDQRRWDCQQDRIRCRQQQEECEKMHLELLAIEAQCEAALQTSREAIEHQIDRVDAGRRAAASYAEAPAGPARGGRLDLSSD